MNEWLKDEKYAIHYLEPEQIDIKLVDSDDGTNLCKIVEFCPAERCRLLDLNTGDFYSRGWAPLSGHRKAVKAYGITPKHAYNRALKKLCKYTKERYKPGDIWFIGRVLGVTTSCIVASAHTIIFHEFLGRPTP